MLRTNTVTQFLYCQPGKEEVIELPGAINGSGIINDMIVYMGFVDVSGNNESVFALRPAHRRFIANLICFFRCYFSGLKRLANLISDDIVLLLSTRDVLILPFGKQKFFISSLRIALIRTDKFTIIGL